MTDLDKILLVAIVSSLICIFSLKLIYTFLYSRYQIMEINSPDSNISTSKIEEIIQNLKTYLKATDLNIEYANKDSYQRIYQMLNKRQKTIQIPKWFMPSVGYELDYIIASIWYNVKLYQKDKYIKKFNFISVIMPLFLSIIYYLFVFLSFLLYLINYFIFTNPVDLIANPIMNFLISYPIIQIICITSFLVLLINIFYVNRLKSILEAKFEIEIIAFVDQYCTSYKHDISAARVYSNNIQRINLKIFRFNSKTSNMKFLGPFTFL
ncbi:transmembrane protein [Spiroplasma corruscae]|uniref:Transmembrane protein n=1 Tax=Spiroplasma corruscae TaxID=216934 RepID=A0A222EPW7_9MOLU|nr:hypothetical protein [Spiroplasma corruscae]ASP28580.1 transmembrane protein [Spiroplasma corruscae]